MIFTAPILVHRTPRTITRKWPKKRPKHNTKVVVVSEIPSDFPSIEELDCRADHHHRGKCKVGSSNKKVVTMCTIMIVLYLLMIL